MNPHFKNFHGSSRGKIAHISHALLFFSLIVFTTSEWAAAQWLDPRTGKPLAPKGGGQLAKTTRKVDWSSPGQNEGIALMDAISEGKIELLEQWMSEGFDVDGLYSWGNHRLPPLSFSMEAKNIEIARFFLDEGADVDQLSDAKLTDYETAKEESLRVESAEEKQAIYDDYSEMIEVFSPLMHAASADFPKGVALLVENGADVDVNGAGGLTALMAAADSDSVESLKILLEAGSFLDERLEDKESLEGLNAGGKLLMKIGAGNASALWIAAGKGHVDVVKLLLDAGADRETEGYCGDAVESMAGEKLCSPARIAGIKKHHKVVDLLQGGEEPKESQTADADGEIVVDLRTPEGRRALGEKLRWILKNDDLEAFQAYINAGLDINTGGEPVEGIQLLSEAVSFKAMKILNILINAGADVNSFSRVEKTFKFKEGENRWRSETKIVNQYTPLMTAAMNGCTECVDMLIEAGANVNATRYDGCTALMNAGYMGGDKIAQKLIKAGADVDAVLEMEWRTRLPFVNGATALWISAWRGNAEVFKLLLEAGADPDMEADCREERKARKGEEACSVRRITELRERAEMSAFIDRLSGGGETAPVTKGVQTAAILDNDVKREKFHSKLRTIAQDQDVTILKGLIDEGLSVDVLVDMGGLVPMLSLAILSGNNEGVRLLMKEGADPDLMSLNHVNGNLGNTGFIPKWDRGRHGEGIPRNFIPVYSPLMYAAFKGNIEAIDLLLDSGADINAAGVGSMTALMAAASENKPLALNKLIKAGTYLDHQIDNKEGAQNVEADGATALWLAAYTGSKATVAILLKAGADPSIQAECRNPKAAQNEETCDARQVAELREHTVVTKIIDRFLEARNTASP